MGVWRAIASPVVDEQTIRAVLAEQGASWAGVAHVTATGSLGRALRRTGSIGMPIATLLDLVLLPSNQDMSLSTQDFPGPDVLGRGGTEVYEKALSLWQKKASGRRFRMGIQFDDALRRYSRTTCSQPALGKILVSSKREFMRTIQAMIASGLRPAHMQPRDPMTGVAVEAWRWLEKELPWLDTPRRDLWMDFDEFRNQSTSEAQALRDRIQRALESAFGVVRGKRTVVHHGFYFYTPPQWAFFQLLRCVPNVDQVFIVHDDGSSPVFETWRRFFVDKWDMPTPDRMNTAGSSADSFPPTTGVEALVNALQGEHIDDRRSEYFSILECRDAAELVRQRRLETSAGESDPRWFAADSKSVGRLLRRLGRTAEHETSDLAQLPVGSFLLAIHDCIRAQSNASPVINMSFEALLDIACSGFLELSENLGSSIDYVEALLRAAPFFGGCSAPNDWRSRAVQLQRLILTEVIPLGGREAGLSDLARLDSAAHNPLRLVPWGDISALEVDGIVAIIDAALLTMEEVGARERVVLKDHWGFLRKKLEKGMQALSQRERTEIAAKVEGFSVGLDEEIDVDGLVDVVAMLLGRSVEFDGVGELEVADGSINDLRGLDALGFRKEDRGIHIANLSQDQFPSVTDVVGWPFSLDDIRDDDDETSMVVRELLKTRQETAALSDLYLFWLALDGVSAGHPVTLSWISEYGGERRSPSPFLSLLMKPRRAPDSIVRRAGGLTPSLVPREGDMGPHRKCPTAHDPSGVQSLLEKVATRIDPRVGAAAIVCPRRLALQWLVGESPAYQAEHHQTILHGNMAGALVKLNGIGVQNAIRTSNDMWTHLTPGQRASSIQHSRVKPWGIFPTGEWILTLGGGKDGKDAIDVAYQTATMGRSSDPDVLFPEDSAYLPVGVSDPAACRQCPVSRICASSVSKN